MRGKQRALPKVIASLESLDDRVLPSAAATAHVMHAHAALIHHRLQAAQVSHNLARTPHSAVVAANRAATATAHAARPAVSASAIAVPARASAAPPAVTAPQTVPLQGTVTTAATQTPTTPTTTTPVRPIISGPTSTPTTTTTTTTTTTDVGDIHNGPLAKAGQDLITLFQEFEKAGQGGGTFTSSLSNHLRISGTSVEVDVQGSGDVNALASALTSMGMQVVATSPTTGAVEGYLPIAHLVNAAQLPQTLSMSPVSIPMRR